MASSSVLKAIIFELAMAFSAIAFRGKRSNCVVISHCTAGSISVAVVTNMT